MRVLLGLAAVTTLILSIPSARAEEWCGFIDKNNARVKCGYSSLAKCQQALLDKKGAYCVPDPSFAGVAGRKRIALK